MNSLKTSLVSVAVCALQMTLPVLLLTGNSRADEAAPFYLKDGDKVVFYGDSITEQRLYTTFTETYVVTRFPHLNISFVHSGWGGDHVTGGGGGPIDQRLERDVFAYQPTVVTFMLGMNDGGYQAFSQPIADTYQQGYQHIMEQVQAKLPAARITLIQPSPYDDVTRPPKFDGGYNAVLLQYAGFVRDLADKYKQTTSDFNTPVTAMLTQATATDPTLAQNIIPDRIHPSPAGHLIMAEALLKTWNAPSLVSNVEIDAAASKVIHADGTKVDGLQTTSGITWTQTDASLPMPIGAQDPTTALVLKSSDWVNALDQETLRVTGLKGPAYSIVIDDNNIGTFTSDDLAKGINLATLSTPMSNQAAKVHALTLQHNDLHFARWRSIQVTLGNKNIDVITKTLPSILDALDTEEKGVVAQQHEAAQPVPHQYALMAEDADSVGGDVVPPESVLPQGLGPNLALNKKSISSDPNTSGWDTGLTDGSWVSGQSTTYATGADPSFPKTVTIDLEKAESLGYVLVGVPAFGSTKKITVSLSADGTTFTKVGASTFPQSTEFKHLYSFPETSARYIRLTYQNHWDPEVGFPNTYAFTSEVEAYAPLAK